MKKLISLILLLSFCACIFASPIIDTSSLSEEKRLEYLKKSLSINYGTKTESTVYASNYGYGMSIGSGESTTKTEWTPFMGGMEVKKTDFFHLLGEYGLEEQQRKVEKQNKTNHIVGWTIFGVGMTTMFCSLIPLQGENPNFGLCYGLLAAGGCVGLLSIPFVCSNKKLDVSLSFIAGLTDNYNLKLYNSLAF